MLGRLQTGPMERKPALVEHVEHVKVRIDALGALDMQDGGELARVDAVADVGRIAADLHLALRGPLDAHEECCHMQRDLLARGQRQG